MLRLLASSWHPLLRISQCALQIPSSDFEMQVSGAPAYSNMGAPGFQPSVYPPQPAWAAPSQVMAPQPAYGFGPRNLQPREAHGRAVPDFPVPRSRLDFGVSRRVSSFIASANNPANLSWSSCERIYSAVHEAVIPETCESRRSEESLTSCKFSASQSQPANQPSDQSMLRPVKGCYPV